MFKVTTAYGELSNHRLILTRLKRALAEKDFSLTVVFPTLSLLNAVQEELLAAEANCIGGIRFLLFEGLIREVCQLVGVKQQLPPPLVRDLLVKEAFQDLYSAGKIDYLGQAPFAAGYRRAVLAGIAEWKRSCLTPDFFSEWAAERTDREKQLALLYRRYQELLIEKGYDEEDLILLKLAKARRQALAFRERSAAILYGFTDLTPLQNRFLEIISSWFDFELIIDPTPVPGIQSYIAGHFSLAAFAGTPNLQSANALNKLQAYFGTKEPGQIRLEPGDVSVQLLETAGWSRQASGIAREMASLLRQDSGYCLEDFLIISPEPQIFLKAAAPVFHDYRLPLRNEPVAAGEFPSVKLFTQILAVCETDWLWPEMEMIIRQYYTGESAAEGDRIILELSQRYGALSGRERWLSLIGNKDFIQYFHEKGLNLHPLSRRLEFLSRIPGEARLKDYLILAQNWFREVLTGDKPDFRRNGGNREQGFGDFKAVKTIIQTITEINDYLADASSLDKEIGLKEFQVFWADYLLPLEVEDIVPRRSGIRTVVPQEARGLRARVVFITGLEQGVFPGNYIHDWKLSLSARRELKASGIVIETGDEYQIKENMAFYWSLQAAQDRLYLVHRNQDDSGQPLNRSRYLDEIRQYFPDLFSRVKHYPLAPKPPVSFAECYSGFEEKSRLASCLIAAAGEIPAAEYHFCRELLKLPWYRRLASQAWQWRQWRTGAERPFLKNPSSLDLLRKLFGADYTFGITALEDFNACPYRFFFKHLLKADPLIKSELLPDNLDLGNLYHQVLHDFGDYFRGEVISGKNSQDHRRVLFECFEDFYREWRDNAANDLIRLVLAVREEQIRATLEQWLNSEYLWAEQSAERFKISFLEFGFGLVRGDYDPASLAAPYRMEAAGMEVRIWGKVDRVDVDDDGNFIVYDYKSGRGPSTKDLLQLKSFQIPVYLSALEDLRFGAGKATGGGYLGLKEPSRSRGGVWHQDRIRNALTGKSLLDGAEWVEWLQAVKIALAGIVQAIRDGEFYRTDGECPPFCEYKSCCRVMEREVTAPDETSLESTAG